MIRAGMPSPIGHSLAGIVVAWTADLVPGDRGWRTAPRSASFYDRAGGGLTLACAALAAAADLDLLSPAAAHRAYTHGLGAIVLVMIIAALVTGWVTWQPKRNVEHAEHAEEKFNPEISAGSEGSALIILRVALMCGAAYGSHVLLDWMAADDTAPYGIRALWSFSRAWYISGWDLFAGTARRDLLSKTSTLQNARAVAQELAILVPLAWGVWLVRVKTLARLPSQVAGRDHPAQ